MLTMKFLILLLISLESVFGATIISGFNCVKITQCPSLANLLKSKPVSEVSLQIIKTAHCGFDKLIEKVWCPVVENQDEEPKSINSQGLNTISTETKSTSTESPKLKSVDLKIPSILPDITECGNQGFNKIVGGEQTELDEFPWTVVLQYKIRDKLVNNCGGVLISKRHVLTAAHCITTNGPPSVAVLGEYDLNNETDCYTTALGTTCSDQPQRIDIEKFMIHPEWPIEDPRPFYNDIAILKLTRDAEFSEYVQPICLPSSNFKEFEQVRVFAAGWGLTENDTKSNIKLKVDLPKVNTAKCAKIYGRYIGRGQICAGGEVGKDSCKGDSGGPLMTLNSNAQWVVTGLVQTGPIQCGTKDIPGIYTYIAYYLSWIYKEIERL